MAFNCRIFGYQGIVQVRQRIITQFSSDAVFLPDEPCLWSQVIAVNGAVPVSSVVVNLTPDNTSFVCVEVPDGQQIRYEVQPQGGTAVGARVAGNLSRRGSGFFNIAWNAGYVLSIVDAASFL